MPLLSAGTLRFMCVPPWVWMERWGRAWARLRDRAFIDNPSGVEGTLLLNPHPRRGEGGEIQRWGYLPRGGGSHRTRNRDNKIQKAFSKEIF